MERKHLKLFSCRNSVDFVINFVQLNRLGNESETFGMFLVGDDRPEPHTGYNVIFEGSESTSDWLHDAVFNWVTQPHALYAAMRNLINVDKKIAI